MMQCPQCGRDVEVSANFCPNCGAKLATGQSSEATHTIPAVTDERQNQTHEFPTEVRNAIRDLPSGSALLVVEQGPDEGARFLLDTDQTSAGRHTDSGIFLDDVTVSRHHAMFVRAGKGFTVQDMSSLNGTYVNRTLVEGPTDLRTGDEVQIGKYRMIYCAPEVSETGRN
ncbi:FHA domain-containing protein [Aestuariimicrobium soli]|uniref:FHA domain-containing protein n=1 Tax=Aestuariimicrobium soli TaxID=2035834 RepID=UPI003EB9313C